ncbi:MAG: response regulator transcription factor [Pseudomonadota bacterium]
MTTEHNATKGRARWQKYGRRTALIAGYGAVLAGGAFLLQWLEYRYLTKTLAPEVYISIIGAGFAALGLWAGLRLRAGATNAPRITADQGRDAAAAKQALSVTDREFAVLELLAQGRSNKEIARDLSLSPNTVKTHLSNLYGKLGVNRRTEALNAARSRGLIA